MNSPKEVDAEALGLLDRLRCFAVEPCRRPMSADGHHPGFGQVIRPLLAVASEGYVWPPTDKRHPAAYPAEILIRERGRFRFDLSKDVLAGYESFWHANAGRRGSIAIRLPRLPEGMEAIFARCSSGLSGYQGPMLLSSRYQLSKADLAGAIRYCDAVIDGGEYAFLFFASNGISIMSVFAPRLELVRLYQLAAEHCAPFQRWRRGDG